MVVGRSHASLVKRGRRVLGGVVIGNRCAAIIEGGGSANVVCKRRGSGWHGQGSGSGRDCRSAYDVAASYSAHEGRAMCRNSPKRSALAHRVRQRPGTVSRRSRFDAAKLFTAANTAAMSSGHERRQTQGLSKTSKRLPSKVEVGSPVTGHGRAERQRRKGQAEERTTGGERKFETMQKMVWTIGDRAVHKKSREKPWFQWH
jgi:hypothetical protein